MNKMNKKGFTLIEMLVVIAVIAVLVSIIIPTVTSATDKAAAATNAANMRSWKAELVTDYLANGKTNFKNAAGDAAASLGTSDEVVTSAKFDAPDVKSMKDIATGTAMVAKWIAADETFVITIKVGSNDYDIDDFAYYADKGEWPAG